MGKQEKKPEQARGKKQIADAVLYDKNQLNGEDTGTKPGFVEKREKLQAESKELDKGFNGDINMPPMELDDEEKKKLATQSLEKELMAKQISDATIKHENGLNVWRLISKAENKILGWNNVVTAMNVGHSRGVIVCVKESHRDNATISTVFIQNAILEETNGKWFLK